MTILSPRSREGDPTGHGQGLDLGRLGVTKPGSTPLEGALLEVNEAILRGLPLRELLVLIARKARSVIGASLVAICTPAADGSGQAVRTAIGLGARRLRGWTIPAGDGDAGTLRLGRQPRIVVLDAGPGLRCLPPGLAGHLGSALIAPLEVPETRLGLMLLANPAGGERFTGRDLKPIQLLASQAAVAIHHQQMRAATMRIGLPDDRERIEGELQDAVVQALYGVGLSLQGALPLARQSVLQQQLERAIGDIDWAVSQLRSHISQLRPAVFPDRMLGLALRRLAAHFADRSHMTIEVEVDAAVVARVAEQTEQLLLAVSARLAELGRRADIVHCRISLRQQEDDLAVLEIADDGRGVHAEEARLAEIRELVAELGGEVEVEIAPERGATLRASIPI